eukprot:CAMPEP_0172433690 /NCGR_PEP_ID=MMETSP1064-20121228/69253_1 /TAXON_ID=202472 /ORGANISM="Aulacoseira subarctica , Strain CCAP 1002/5" /LENGTH=53 /DNA_ID=CAMNT_0013181757 /DNA_START=140 /DNA_END=298 /DNA_ORIENTATION=+
MTPLLPLSPKYPKSNVQITKTDTKKILTQAGLTILREDALEDEIRRLLIDGAS